MKKITHPLKKRKVVAISKNMVKQFTILPKGISNIRKATKRLSEEGITSEAPNLHDAIIQRIGRNKPKEKKFDEVYVLDQKLSGFYTSKGEVFIVDSIGVEIPFKAYDNDTQAVIHQAIINEKYDLLLF